MSEEESTAIPCETQRSTALLAMHVSLFHGARPKPVDQRPLFLVLESIKSGVNKEQVAYLQQLLATHGKTAYDDARKANLAGFTPAGVFAHRANAKLTTANGLVHFDIDGLPDLAAAKALKARLLADPYVAYAFISPSGTGLKFAVWVDGIIDDRTYKHAWNAVLAYFANTYPDLAVANDKQCKDISRLCFVSHDPDLYINPQPKRFDVPPAQAPTPKPQPTHAASTTRPRAQTTGNGEQSPPIPADRRERYARQGIDRAVQMIQAGIPKTDTAPGTRHESQLKAAKLLGGYVAGGVLSHAEAYAPLKAAVEGNTSDFTGDMETIMDGLSYGEAEPITFDQLEAERLDWLASQATATVNGHSVPGSRHTSSQGAAPQREQAGVTTKFKWTKDQRPRPITSNVEAVFQHDPRWQGVLALDELANDVMLLQCPPYLLHPDPWQPRALRDWDVAETSIWLQRAYDLCLTTNAVGEVIEMYAARFAYHVVRDYLNSLTWDHTPRLDRWLMTYCHAPDTAYTHAVGRNTLIAAVARVMQPGCKVDTVCILEGEQGTFKSTVWRTLASDAWFSDTMPVNLADKDAAQSLRGKWIIELGELAAMRHNEKEVLKRFVSSPSDHYRPSYGRRAASFPRMSVFVGTTNQHEIFDDETGNRRYWPVPVTGLCDIAALERDRDQLWAEALGAYRQGNAWHLTPELELEAVKEQRARVEPDDWEAPILSYLDSTKITEITTGEILAKVFNLDKAAWTPAHTKRVGRLLRRNNWQRGNASSASNAPRGSKTYQLRKRVDDV